MFIQRWLSSHENEKQAGGMQDSGRQDFICLGSYSRVLNMGCNVSKGFLKHHVNPSVLKMDELLAKTEPASFLFWSRKLRPTGPSQLFSIPLC